MDLRTYLESLPYGAKAKLAREIGIDPPFLYQLAVGIRSIPAARVLAIEQATGYRVSRHELRPDLYPREPWCRCPACERAAAGAPRGPAEEGEAA